MKVSILIPCYNEEEVIEETSKRVVTVLENNKYDYEVLFINDGSADSTLSLLKKCAETNERIKILNFSRNFGHQAAVTAGIGNCSGDVAIIIDADLQDPPELFPDMIKMHLDEGCNVVYGVRKTREKESFFKKITSKMFYRFVNFLSEVKFPLDTGDFRLIDRKVINAFKKLDEKNKYIRGLISWLGFSQKPIFYDRAARFSGETKYSLTKMLALALRGIFYFTKKPLKLSISIGFISILVSLALTIYVVVSLFFSKQIMTGWASTLITIIFFGGVQLFMIGILGEYIGNIFEEIKNRPEFVVKDFINFPVSKEKSKSEES